MKDLKQTFDNIIYLFAIGIMVWTLITVANILMSPTIKAMLITILSYGVATLLLMVIVFGYYYLKNKS